MQIQRVINLFELPQRRSERMRKIKEGLRISITKPADMYA